MDADKFYDLLQSDVGKDLLCDPRIMQQFQHRMIMDEIAGRYFSQQIFVSAHLKHTEERRFVVERISHNGHDRLEIYLIDI